MSPVNVDEDPLRGKVRIVTDAVTEMFNSLHVLAEPEHHLSNQDWAEATLATMPADLREELTYFCQYYEWLNIADISQRDDIFGLSVPAFLERLAQIPAITVVNAALGLPGVPGAPESANNVEDALVYAPATLEAREMALHEPVMFVQRLLRTLKRYWTESFAAEWERRYHLLDQRRALEASRLDTSSPVVWLTTLHDRISYEVDSGQLVFHKQHDLRYTLAELERITCIPSTFIVPHLLVGYQERRLFIAINVAPVMASLERVPLELLEVAKALADETRLRIFKAVLRHPHYTQELALSMNLAEPTVSRHLKILKSAKLVRSYKEGAVVQYAGLLEPVDRLPAAMRTFLRM